MLHVSPEVISAGKSGPWPDVRRAAITSLAGDVAAWAADSHEHIAVCVLAAEIDEWSAGQVPFGVTSERQAAYVAVAALKRDRFQAAMADIVADTFHLVLTNWAVITAVAVELRSGPHLSGADMERLIDGRVVVPADVVIRGGADVH